MCYGLQADPTAPRGPNNGGPGCCLRVGPKEACSVFGTAARPRALPRRGHAEDDKRVLRLALRPFLQCGLAPPALEMHSHRLLVKEGSPLLAEERTRHHPRLTPHRAAR